VLEAEGEEDMGSRQLTLGIALLGVVAGTAVLAQEEGPPATGVVAVRQATMKANAGHAGAIKSILSEYPQALSQVAYHAAAIRDSSEHVPSLFPAGSDEPPTQALPAVWSDQAGFKAAADKTEVLAQKLVDAARTGDAQATTAAFATLGKEGCGGCHTTFRKKQN
jgi:cytochrome c556